MAKFWKDAQKAIEKKEFNEDLLYTLHAPCSLSCPETIKMVEGIKKSLELNDSMAAKTKREETQNLINLI